MLILNKFRTVIFVGSPISKHFSLLPNYKPLIFLRQMKLQMRGCLRCCCINLMQQNHNENHREKYAEGGWALELLGGYHISNVATAPYQI